MPEFFGEASRGIGSYWRESRLPETTAHVRSIVGSGIFGDGNGFLIFLGSLLFFGIYWRIGIFVTDNWTIANTLVAIADGQLHLERQLYGPPGVLTPGMNIIEGTPYGRNYGQVVLALPLFWLVEAMGTLFDLRIVIAGAWSLGAVGFVSRIGSRFDLDDTIVSLGTFTAIAIFVVNVWFAVPIDPASHYLIALQLGSMLSAAMLGVMTYRLVASVHDARTGAFIAVATIMASPVGFWASLPKRHVHIGFLVMVVIFAFYCSRMMPPSRLRIWYRSVAYAAVGIAAWIHAPEALVVLVVFAPLDFLTARPNSPRELTVVAAVFLTSLIPFFLTNQFIAGHPLRPPRLLSRAPTVISDTATTTPTPAPESATPEPTTATEPAETPTSVSPVGTTTSRDISGVDSPSSTPPNQPTWDGPIERIGDFGVSLHKAVSDLLVDISTPLVVMFNEFEKGFHALVEDPDRVYQTIVRSTHRNTRATVTDLSLIESSPMLSLIVGLPIAVIIRFTSPGPERIRILPSSPVRQTNLLVVLLIIVYLLLYMSRLPLNAMWTVRYLLPVVPLGLYLVSHLGTLREVLKNDGELLVWLYAGLVLIGGQFLLVFLVMIEPTRGEVMQFHGILGIIAATVSGVWVLLATLKLIDDSRVGALALSASMATGTWFVLFTGFEYFVVNHFALAVSELLSNAIPLF